MSSNSLTADNIFFYSLAAAIIPVLLYIGLIYWVDRYEKEPWWLLSAAFVWGALPAALLALIFNFLFSLPFYALFSEGAAEFTSAGFLAPVIEESVKALALLIILIFRRHELDSPLDGIIYGAMVGMGFAMVENVLYYLAAFSEDGGAGWNMVVLIRGVVFGLNHALYTALTGLGIAVARTDRRPLVRFGAPLLGLGAAILLHALHNVSMFGGTAAAFVFGLTFGWGGVLITLVIIGLALYQERRWLRHYLADEVELGTLTAAEYEIISSAARRNRHRWRLLLNDGLGAYQRSGRRFQQCSELAYRKRHQAHFNDPAGPAAIADLRRSIQELG
jgi:RsiW-degrading membrane proteinase PrsW (M82 family)